MKRLAVVLAAAVLGTGCIGGGNAPPCDSNVTVDWSFRDADGGVTTSCAAAGVAWIDVFVNGPLVATFDCAGPPGVVPLAPGTNDLYVEGIDGFGAIRYRDHFPVSTSSCGSQGTVASQPAEGWLAVDYSFSPANACFSPGPTYMWLEVHDDLASLIAFADTGMTALQVCSVVSPAPRYRLPVGAFTLIGIQEMFPTGGAPAVVGADCTPRPFDVGAAAVTTVFPVLVDSSFACF